MNGAELYSGSSRSLDSLRHMRLLAPLRDMIDDGGKVKAAKALGVNYRTVSKAVRSGTLTDRMSDALERHLLLGAARLPPSSRIGSMRWWSGCLLWSGSCAAASRPSWERSRRSGRSTQGRCGTWSGGWCDWRREGASPRRPLRPEQRLSRRSEGTFAQGRIPSW